MAAECPSVRLQVATITVGTVAYAFEGWVTDTSREQGNRLGPHSAAPFSRSGALGLWL